MQSCRKRIFMHHFLAIVSMHMHDYLGRHGPKFDTLIAQVASKCAAKLVEIVIYDRSTVQFGCIWSICYKEV